MARAASTGYRRGRARRGSHRPPAPRRREAVHDRRRVEQGVRAFLEGIGRARLGGEFESTVARVTDTWCDELLRGYAEKPEAILTPIAIRPGRGWVVARDLPFASLCVHHLLPFFGRAHIVFLPGRSLVGLSKLARLVDCFSRRLQMQEALTRQVLEALTRRLRPRGAAVLLEAEHLCMSVRGVRSQGSRVLTAAFSGSLERGAGQREAVLRLLGLRARS